MSSILWLILLIVLLPFIIEIVGVAVGVCFAVTMLFLGLIFVLIYGFDFLIGASIVGFILALCFMPLLLQAYYIEYVKDAFKTKSREKLVKIKINRALFIFLRASFYLPVFLFVSFSFWFLFVVTLGQLFLKLVLPSPSEMFLMISGVSTFIGLCMILYLANKKRIISKISQGINIKRFDVSTSAYKTNC